MFAVHALRGRAGPTKQWFTHHRQVRHGCDQLRLDLFLHFFRARVFHGDPVGGRFDQLAPACEEGKNRKKKKNRMNTGKKQRLRFYYSQLGAFLPSTLSVLWTR